MVQCRTTHLHRTGACSPQHRHDARAAWRHDAAPAAAARVDGMQHVERRCGGLTDVRSRRRRWGASPTRKLGGREGCGGNAHAAGEEATSGDLHGRKQRGEWRARAGLRLCEDRTEEGWPSASEEQWRRSLTLKLDGEWRRYAPKGSRHCPQACR
jgi:hypothetical protein